MAKSEPPDISGINISTPTCSSIYPWSDQDRKKLQELREYHYNCLVTIEELESNGPANVILPMKPRTGIESLVETGKKKPKKQVLWGQQLHEYMCQHLIEDVTFVCPEMGDNIYPDLQSILPFLVTGNSELSNSNSTSFATHLKFGQYLRQAFELFKQRKYVSQTRETWVDWLKSNLGLSATYAKEMRDMSRLFHSCKKFRRLTLPFSEMYRRRNEIENLFLLHPEIVSFWCE